MDASGDELAGVVDRSGGLTREEGARALADVAALAGADAVDDAAVAEAVETARDRDAPPEVDHDDGPLLVAGPAALPSVPLPADDLPHILEVSPRTVEAERRVATTIERFDREAEWALGAGDVETVDRLLEVTDDHEAWAAVDVAAWTERLRRAIPGGGD